jgi:hypothetical protein
MVLEGAPLRAEVQPRTEKNTAEQRVHLFTDAIHGREPFLKLRKDWDAALLAGPDASPAIEHDFLRLWLENFAASETPVLGIARRADRIRAALGLTLSTARLDGVPVRLATGWTNSHSTRGGLLLGPEGLDAVPSVIHRLMEEPWDVLSLRDVPAEGGCLEAVSESLRKEGCVVAYESPMESPYIPLPGDWTELEKRLDARFRQNLRRRRRRLEEHGPVTFEVITSQEGLDAALEDAFAIEASGWKGESGGAIRARPELVAFYAGWARRLAQEGRLRLCFLKLGDRRIAFHFGYIQRGRYYLPKCGFDEAFQECSPGQLLMVDVLKRCIEERLETFEFLGFTMPWKRDWTPLVRPHACVMAYRPTWRGRLAEKVRVELRPKAIAAWREIQARVRGEQS